MYTLDKKIDDIKLLKYINSYLELFKKAPENTVFFDIETTGLSPRNSFCFLLGFIHYNENYWEESQLFCESMEDEKILFLTFNTILKQKKNLNLVHFNGNSFDIPFVKNRIKILNLNIKNEFLVDDDYESFDILKIIRTLKFLNLENYKQKTIEKFIEINRQDVLSGKELIKTYKEFIAFRETSKRDLILLHNHEDLTGMLYMLPLLNFIQLKHPNDYIKDSIYYTTASDALYLKVNLSYTFAKKIELRDEITEFILSDNQINAKIKLYNGGLKYFYENYHDYYFIPSENKVIHKSVATYIDKEFRKKATKQNCYISLNSLFVPIFSKFKDIHTFKAEYDSKLEYIEAKDFDKINKNNYLKGLISNCLNIN